MRPSRRAPDELRPITLERGVVKYAEGSCMVKFGDTHVLVTATLEDRLPPWLKGQGRGWVTAEYGMLPRATHERMRRESAAGKQSGRTVEIQRLIGRSLRTTVDLVALGERQITVDCDVIQADGGTRTASITGAWVALADCLQWMKARNMLKNDNVLRDNVAAISCGIYNGTPVLDLDYAEDLRGRDRCKLRHDRRWPHRRGAGHGRKNTVLAGRVPEADGAGAKGHRPAGGPAKNGSGVKNETSPRLRGEVGEQSEPGEGLRQNALPLTPTSPPQARGEGAQPSALLIKRTTVEFIMHRRITGRLVIATPQSRQACRDARTAGAPMAWKRCRRLTSASANQKKPAQRFRPMRASRPWRRRTRHSFPPSQMTRDSRSMRSTASPESIRRAGPERTRISWSP